MTQIDKIFCFSACKNDLKSAAEKFKKDLPPECASSCEEDFYLANRLILQKAGVEIQPSSEKHSYAGISYVESAKVVLMPEFGVTLKEIKSRIKGDVRISAKSTLVIENEVTLENFDLDGSVWVTNAKELKDVQYQEKNYVEFKETLEEKDPAFIKIRGYHAVGKENIKHL